MRAVSLFRGFLIAIAVFAMLVPTAAAEKTGIDVLCRIHGIGQEDDIAKIKTAYADALDAGITEDELYPFVQDVLSHKLDCPQLVKVLSVTIRLRRENLPYFVVFSKVREGMAKGAPPVLIVDAAESKLKTLFESRDVLRSLEKLGYRVRDFQNAAVVVSSYIEKGYAPEEVVLQVRKKGVDGAGFAALAGVLEKPVKRRDR